jgi:pyruvate dehydrogenase E1 component alpha subunit
LVECKTYRHSGHSRGDPRKYRSRDEEEAWMTRAPIRRFRAVLREKGLLSAEDDRRIRAEARAIVAEAVRFARRSPDPDPATIEEGVFA